MKALLINHPPVIMDLLERVYFENQIESQKMASGSRSYEGVVESDVYFLDIGHLEDISLVSDALLRGSRCVIIASITRTNPESVRHVIQVCEANHVPVLYGVFLAYNKKFLEAKALLEVGAIGEPNNFHLRVVLGDLLPSFDSFFVAAWVVDELVESVLGVGGSDASHVFLKLEPCRGKIKQHYGSIETHRVRDVGDISGYISLLITGTSGQLWVNVYDPLSVNSEPLVIYSRGTIQSQHIGDGSDWVESLHLRTQHVLDIIRGNDCPCLDASALSDAIVLCEAIEISKQTNQEVQVRPQRM
jgi:predicted dehydrogenase